MNVSSVDEAASGGGGRAASSADESGGGSCSLGNRFVAGTAVLMADGTVEAIEDVQLGDLVWANDPETGELGPRRVSDLIEGTGVKGLVEIEVDGDTITATDGHPFWVDDEGRWVDAEDLDVGDLLLLADGTTTEVDGITHHRETLTVHNLTVEGIHTHHVAIGNDAALVHNASDLCETLDPSTIRFTQDSVSPTFSDERTIGALADGLRDGSTRAADVPAIRVTEVDGQLFTLDNRRLVAFQQAGVPVSVQRVDAASIAKELERKMTTNNGGTSIMIRGGGGVWTP